MLFITRITVPIATIISLTDSDWLFNGEAYDFTWSAILPTIWIQVSLGLSIITASIPNIKGFLDIYLGNTLRVDMDAPYQLTRIDKGSLQASANQTASQSQSRDNQESHLHGRRHRSSLVLVSRYKSGKNAVACYKAGASAIKTNSPSGTSRTDGDSESTKNLKDGVIFVRDEVEVSFGERERPLYCGRTSSQESFEETYHQHVQR
ncbi:hypothetical protein F4780DRAFT_798063 [Xylariomycetidae sp. FL0641]|nr:hypothetical protein F4780DRAFT_798063 [Xylariomycetidae sp. FL0641]